MIKRPPPIRLFVFTFLVHALAFTISMSGPSYFGTGDQVYYLTMTASLWQDHDLDLRDEYSSGDYRDWYPQELSEKELTGHHITGRDGGLYSRHGAGLPLLMLPGWAVGRQVGAGLVLVMLSSLLGVQLFGLMDTLVPHRPAVWIAWVGIVFAPPLLLYSGLPYTEVPAALGWTLAVRYGLLERPSRDRRHDLLALAGCWLLPLLNPRNALLLLPLVVLLWFDDRRWLAALAAAGVMLPMALFVFQLGTIPTLGNYGHLSLTAVPAGLAGMWLDREAGLLPYAPIYLLALWGLARVRTHPHPAWRRWPWLWLPYLFFLAGYSAWFGGWNPPGRMMVPLLPALAPLIVLALADLPTIGQRAAALILGGAGILTGVLLVYRPLLQYNRMDGSSALFSWITALDLNWVWPSIVHPSRFTGWQVALLLLIAGILYGRLYRKSDNRP